MEIKAYPYTGNGLGTRFAKRDEAGNVIIESARLPPQNWLFEYDMQTSKPVFKPLQVPNPEKMDVIKPYIPSKELIDLVRLMQIVRRPVLLKGEPGSGKTQLANAVAYEWYGPEYKKHYFEWHIKSHSKAVDGLYKFDHLERLRDAQLAQFQAMQSKDATQKKRIDYRTFGPLAQAFLTSTPESPSILLIDEIDKADIDFPNDLLLELDAMRFYIPDTEEHFEAIHPPLIFITSNDERELPEAFLRRCLFTFMQFPKEPQLREILKAHLPKLFDLQVAYQQTAVELIDAIVKEEPELEDPAIKNPNLTPQPKDFVGLAIKRFELLRKKISKDPSDNKRASTSELIDWLKAFQTEMGEGGKIKSPEQIKDFNKLPMYFQVLLKTYSGYKREILEKKEKTEQ